MSTDLEWETSPETTDPIIDTKEPESVFGQPVEDADIDVNEAPIDPEVVPNSSEWFGREKGKGTCEVCGSKAWDGRSYRCETHRETATLKTEKLKRPRGQEPTSTTRKINAASIKKAILDANDDIVKLSAIATGIPSEWLDPRDEQGRPRLVAEVVIGKNEDGSLKQIRFWDPILKDQLSITEKQAELLANGIAAFSETKTGQRIMMVGGAAAPYAALIGAGGVLFTHAVKLGNIKAQVQELKAALHQAQEQGAIPQAHTQNPDDIYQHSTDTT